MGIGLGIVLLLVGLVLALDVITPPAIEALNVEWSTLGWIFVLVGVIAIVLALVMNKQRSASRHTHVEERRIDPR